MQIRVIWVGGRPVYYAYYRGYWVRILPPKPVPLIAEIQRKLQVMGYGELPANELGFMTPATTAQIRRFQEDDKGIVEITGNLDRATINAINAAATRLPHVLAARAERDDAVRQINILRNIPSMWVQLQAQESRRANAEALLSALRTGQ